MVNKPKNIGTAAESAVVKVLTASGFPDARRLALAGAFDQGDIGAAWEDGTPRIIFEVKAGKAAKTASDNQVFAWLDETETERFNADAEVGVLVMARAGIGAANAHRWWAVAEWPDFGQVKVIEPIPMRLLLGDMIRVLRDLGYGEPR